MALPMGDFEELSVQSFLPGFVCGLRRGILSIAFTSTNLGVAPAGAQTDGAPGRI